MHFDALNRAAFLDFAKNDVLIQFLASEHHENWGVAAQGAHTCMQVGCKGLMIVLSTLADPPGPRMQAAAIGCANSHVGEQAGALNH